MNFLYDTFLIFGREMKRSLRNPVWVIIGLISPILYLSLFGPLLVQVSAAKGFPPGSAWQVYVPGLLVQLGLFGSMFVGFGLIGDWRQGIIERMRVTPISRMALLLGRVMRDVVVLTMQSLILIVVGTAFGLRVAPLAAIIALGFVALLAISLASLSYAAGLMTKSEDAFAPLCNMISVPLMLTSGILLPMTLAPIWLQRLCSVNPFLYIVNAMRDVFLMNYAIATVAIGAGTAITLAILSLYAGARTFQRENA